MYVCILDVYKYIYVCVSQFVSEIRVLCTPQELILHAPNLLAYIFICINMH